MNPHHNHVVGCAASVRFRPVSAEVREKLMCLFSRSYNPPKALRTHIEDLKEQYGDRFHEIQGDRHYMPSIQYVYYLYRKTYKSDCRIQHRVKILDKLKEEVADNKNACLRILDDSYNFILSIVTPFMRRVHEKILQSREVSFSRIISTSTFGVDYRTCLIIKCVIGGLCAFTCSKVAPIPRVDVQTLRNQHL